MINRRAGDERCTGPVPGLVSGQRKAWACTALNRKAAAAAAGMVVCLLPRTCSLWADGGEDVLDLAVVVRAGGDEGVEMSIPGSRPGDALSLPGQTTGNRWKPGAMGTYTIRFLPASRLLDSMSCGRAGKIRSDSVQASPDTIRYVTSLPQSHVATSVLQLEKKRIRASPALPWSHCG